MFLEAGAECVWVISVRRSLATTSACTVLHEGFMRTACSTQICRVPRHIRIIHLARFGCRKKASLRSSPVPLGLDTVAATARSKPSDSVAVVKRVVSAPLSKVRRPSDVLKASLSEVSMASLTSAKKTSNSSNSLNSSNSSSLEPLVDSEAKLLDEEQLPVAEALSAEGLRPLNSSLRRRALAFHSAAMAARKSELLEMHPDRLAIQQDILRARSVGRVLAVCSKEELQTMDAVNVVTAIHRIAKLYDGSHIALVENPRFEMMLEAVSKHVDALNPRGMVHLVWSLASLQCWPEWSEDLIGRCMQCDSFTGRDLSVLLGSLAKLATSSKPGVPSKLKKKCKQLQDVLVQQLGETLPELTTSVDLACAAASLSRLQVRDERLFVTIAQQAVPILGEFSMSDVTSLLWALAILNFTHGELCEQIRLLLRQKAEECSPKELTQIAWALSRLHEADEELLRQTIAPVVRAKFLDFEVPRDLCTLAFAYSNVRVFDEGIFNDFAHTLTSKVRLMNAHDVSSVVAAFAGIEYAHKGLFKALQKHTKAIMPSFTPLQLSRTIHGFGTAGVEDVSLYRGLFGQALKQRHLLHASNIVEVLIGLAEAEYVPEGIEELLQDAPRLVKWLDAAECVHALHAMSRLQVDSKDFVRELMKTIRSRAQGWWRFKLRDMADLVEAMVALKLDDSLLLNICAGQLPRLLSRSEDAPTFLRLWGAFADLRPHMRERVQERLQKNSRLRDAVAACLSAAAQGIRAADDADPEHATAVRAAAQLLCACASLAWDQAPVPDVVQMMQEMLHRQEVCQQGPCQHWWAPLAWALAELRYEDLARHVLRPCFRDPLLRNLDGASKLHLVAAVVSLGYSEEFAGATVLLEELACNHEADSDMVLKSLEVELAMAGVTSVPLSPEQEMRTGGAGSRYDFADQISNTLIELGVAHEAKVAVNGHYVQVVLPGQVALLVHSPRELTVSGNQLGSAQARTRQLTSLGWTCKEFPFTQIEEALAAGNLKDLLAPLLSAKLLGTSA